MKSLIKCFKLLKYSAQLKRSIIFMVIIGICGFFMEFASSESQSFIGGFYIFLFPVMIGQMLFTLSMSGLIQSSSYKKKLQTGFPFMVQLPITGISLFVVIAHRAWIVKHGTPGISDAENYTSQAAYIFWLGVIIFFSLVYFGVCYKFFVASLVVFCIIVAVVMTGMHNEYLGLNSIVGKSFEVSVAITVILYLLGNLVSYLISNLLYKCDMSEYMIKRTVGKWAN